MEKTQSVVLGKRTLDTEITLYLYCILFRQLRIECKEKKNDSKNYHTKNTVNICDVDMRNANFGRHCFENCKKVSPIAFPCVFAISRILSKEKLKGIRKEKKLNSLHFYLMRFLPHHASKAINKIDASIIFVPRVKMLRLVFDVKNQGGTFGK